MKRTVASAPTLGSSRPGRLRCGYTLVEMLMATALTLILMFAVVQIFGQIGSSVNDSRSTLEATDRLRAAAARLQMDLQGITVVTIPPRRPDDGGGYVEVIEGPSDMTIPIDNDTGSADTTVRDYDDVLMFTTHSTGRPFVGKCDSPPQKTIESDTAEIAWFLRGRTLYRRVLLVVPGIDLSAVTPAGFYDHYDISARNEGGGMVANSLGDLARRECRFAHDSTAFPFDARGWGKMGLPILADVYTPGAAPAGVAWTNYDFWQDAPTFSSGGPGPRAHEDIILTNVIGFDVKVYDPGAATYVDLNGPNAVTFTGTGDPRSGLNGGNTRVYCTWSFHYEHDGLPQNGLTDPAANGFDDDGNGIVDDVTEWSTAPPYPAPLRGIQVKIRIFEPDSRQIREVTVVQDFLPK